MRVCAARRGAASPASALPPPRPPRRERSGKGPGAERAGRGRRGRPTGGQALPVGAPAQGVPVASGSLPPAARPASPTATPGIWSARRGSITPGVLVLSERQPSAPRAQPVRQGRQPIILPLLPKAEEMRDLPGGEQPPLTEEDGVSAPSRDAGAFHVLLHQGRPWPLIFGRGGGEKRRRFHCERLPSTAASGLPQEGITPAPRHPPCSLPSPGHLQARQEKGETNLINICVRRWRRAENLDLDPLAHCGHVHNTANPPPSPAPHLPAWPGEHSSHRCPCNGCKD